jgi:hypothetical protein
MGTGKAVMENTVFLETTILNYCPMTLVISHKTAITVYMYTCKKTSRHSLHAPHS